MLNEQTSKLPKQEMNIIAGDFNARIIERLPHESDTIGPHIFKEENTDINILSKGQLDNRNRFMEYLQNYQLTPMNTWFEKPQSELITYRAEAKGVYNFEQPLTHYNYGQLDYILVHNK